MKPEDAVTKIVDRDPPVPPIAAGLPLGAFECAVDGASALDASARSPYGRNFIAHAVAALDRGNWLTRTVAESADYAGQQWTTDDLRAELLTVRADRDHLRAQIDRLAGFIMERLPHEIRGDLDPSAVGIAIRLIEGALEVGAVPADPTLAAR